MDTHRLLHGPYRPPSETYRPPIAALEGRIRILRKRYGKGLGRKPTADELESMWRAARLRCIADFALTDPACDANTQVRLANAADRSVARMEALLASNEAQGAPARSLASMLEEGTGATTGPSPSRVSPTMLGGFTKSSPNSPSNPAGPKTIYSLSKAHGCN
jgi:hypothetical protein